MDIATAFFSDEAERGANRARVAEYFWRESGKWAQKQAPEGFGSLKFYGRWGGKEGFNPNPAFEALSEGAAYELRRVMRKLATRRIRAAYASFGRKAPRTAGRPRGRDGMTVFDIDGRAWGPLLTAWAEVCAADKAAERDGSEKIIRWRGKKDVLRAFSELDVDPDPDPEPPEDVFDPEDFGEPDLELDPELEARRLEEHLEQMVDEAVAHERHLAEVADERERRKAVLREQDRERAAWRKAMLGGRRGRQPPPTPST